LTGHKKRTGAALLDRLGLRKPAGTRISKESNVYGRLLPAVILIMGLVMGVLVLFAIAVLVGLIR